MSAPSSFKKVTTHSLLKMKQAGEKIAMVTAYDYSFARLFDAAGMDVILVGDSAGNVMAGQSTTLQVTLDQMIYHGQCVAKAVERALLVVDLPFGTYQSNADIALSSAIRVMKESGAHAIKMEGGAELSEAIRRIVQAGIPVMGHLGLTPQSIYQFGTYAVRAQEKEEAEKLQADALALEAAGCFGVVLEKIPAPLAQSVSQSLRMPTIGIGAGPGCDGQVLVMHDLLGMNNSFKPRFIRQYLALEGAIQGAAQAYIADVKGGQFPNAQESY